MTESNAYQKAFYRTVDEKQTRDLVNPLRFGMNIVRRVYLEGATLGDIWRQFIPLFVLAVVTLPLAAWLFRNRLA